jgi:putative acetyltransferase
LRAAGGQRDAALMLIRRAAPDDRAAIFTVHAAAFARPDSATAGEAYLVEKLDQAGDVVAPLSLVAEVDGHVIGHVVCTQAHVDQQPSLGVGPLGVLPDNQGRGVGSALMHAVLAAADAIDESEVVLVGDPRYYQRFGFQLAEPLGVLPTSAEWTAHLQIRLLTACTEKRGVFHFAPAFDHI